MNQNIEIDKEKIKDEILEDSILTCKDVLFEYIEDKTVHSVLLITFEELLNYVWRTLEMNENKKEIKI
jgi:hypothetical protein